MMIARKISTWHSPHEHHEARRRHAKLEGWPEAKIRSAATGVTSPYPEAIATLFETAVARCPSISADHDVMEGQPCIAGTRIPIRSVLRAIEHYGSIDKAIDCYPHLNANQVQDALFFSQVILELPRGIDETETTPR